MKYNYVSGIRGSGSVGTLPTVASKELALTQHESTEKRCSTCGLMITLDGFHRNRNARDGHCTACKACARQRTREWGVANRDRASAAKRRRYLANPEQAKANAARWAAEHPERRQAIVTAHRKKPSVIAQRTAQARVYRATHRDRVRALGRDAAHRRRLLEERAGHVTGTQWNAIKSFYEYRCLCCRRVEPDIVLTMDHVVPLVAGGTHEPSNIQPLCRACNSAKHTKATDYRPGVHARTITEIEA